MSADNGTEHVAVASVATGRVTRLGPSEGGAGAPVEPSNSAGSRASIDRNLTLAWGLAGAILCVDLAWFPLSRLRIADPRAFLSDLAIVLGVGVCCLVLRAVHLRVAGDKHRIARLSSYVSERSALAAYAFAFQMVLFASVVGFTYLSASVGWPLRDAELAQVDRWLGFDWPGFLTLTNSYPLFAQLLVLAYNSSGPQLILLYLLLALTGRRERVAELFLLQGLISVVTILIYLAVPAVGAYGYYTPSPQVFDHFGPSAGMWHHDTLLVLRNDAVPSFAFEGIQGLVVFPSFHTMLAILTAYGVRDIKGLSFPVGVFNALVIVSTLPVGGHYLIDVIVGIAITCAAIGFIHHRSSSKI